jgi:hypothetical protein
MALDGLRGTEDPGLHARLLHASNAISRPRLCPAMRPHWMVAAEVLTVALITLVAIGWIIATP